MTCGEVEERLPWLVGGGLPEEEAIAIRQHVGECPGCTAALQETQRAADVFAAHLPPSALTDLASDGRGSTAVPLDLAHRHLAGCPECTEELALVRQSLALERAAGPIRHATRHLAGAARWMLPLAAGVVLGLATGALRERSPAPQAPAPQAPDPELQRLRDAYAALEREARARRAPQVNLPVLELFPREVTRSAGGAPPEILVPAGDGSVALLLGGSGLEDRAAQVSLRGPSGEVLWTAEGAIPGPHGAYALAVPAASMTEGLHTLVLEPERRQPVEYPFRVRRAN